MAAESKSNRAKNRFEVRGYLSFSSHRNARAESSAEPKDAVLVGQFDVHASDAAIGVARENGGDSCVVLQPVCERVSLSDRRRRDEAASTVATDRFTASLLVLQLFPLPLDEFVDQHRPGRSLIPTGESRIRRGPDDEATKQQDNTNMHAE